MKNWFFELQKNGHGPDWFCDLLFNENQKSQLGKVFQNIALDGFAKYDGRQKRSLIDGTVKDYDLLIYEHNYQGIVGNIEKTHSTNNWIYHLIIHEDNFVRFERGFGGYDASESEGPARFENKVIDTLLKSPDLGLIKWNIYGGGQGYDFVEVAQGSSALTLQNYLKDD